MASKISALQLARRIVLGTILVAFTVIMFLHQRYPGVPSVDALDPFGGLETLLKFAAGGEFIKKIQPGTLVLFGGVVILGIVVSRFYCGWICSFGALQGVFGWIGKKIFRRRFEVPARLDRALRWLKYPMLVWIVAVTWTTGTLFIRPYDPLAAYGHLPAGIEALITEFTVGFAVLVATMVLSVFYERVFCKYLCPLGAVNAILGRVPLFRIKRDAPTCISCSKCDKVCPMNVAVSGADTASTAECISCMECVTACPTKKNTLLPTLGGKAMKAGIVVAIGFAVYFGTAAVGALAGAGRLADPPLSAMAGGLEVTDIKGSSTWLEVATAFGIETERLYREAGVSRGKVPEHAMLKETGTYLGEDFEVDRVRVAVAAILGVPYAGESGELAMPAKEAPAADAATPVRAASGSAGELVVPADFALEGTMTARQVAEALGADTAAVVKKLGLPETLPLDTPLRDLRTDYGYTMPELKERFAR